MSGCLKSTSKLEAGRMSEILTPVARHLNVSLKVIKYHGHRREIRTAKLTDSDIVLTTYHTLAADVVSNKQALHQIDWYRLVLDEGMNRSLHLPFNVIVLKLCKPTSCADNPPSYTLLLLHSRQIFDGVLQEHQFTIR